MVQTNFLCGENSKHNTAEMLFPRMLIDEARVTLQRKQDFSLGKRNQIESDSTLQVVSKFIFWQFFFWLSHMVSSSHGHGRSSSALLSAMHKGALHS